MTTALDPVRRFLELYNGTEDAAVYPLYADEVDWLELPSGRSGDRDAFFTALRDVRTAVTDMSLEPLSITVGADSGVLESIFRGTLRSTGARIVNRVVWLFEYRDGLIVKERDYIVAALDSDA